MRRSLIGFAVLAAAGIMAAAALADHGSFNDPTGDVVGPTPGPKADFDIVATTYGHSPSGRLVHTTELNGSAGDPSRGESVPLLLIKTPKAHSQNPTCDFFVQVTPPAHQGGVWTGAVFRCANSHPPEQVGRARIVRSDSHTVRYSFSPSAINSPGRYRWVFVFALEGNAFDRAPDTGYETHLLN